MGSATPGGSQAREQAGTGLRPSPVPGAHSSPERADLSIPEHTGDPAFCGSFSVFRPEWFSRARAWPEKVGRDTCCVLLRLLYFCRGSGRGLRTRGHLASQIPHSLTPPRGAGRAVPALGDQAHSRPVGTAHCPPSCPPGDKFSLSSIILCPPGRCADDPE